MTIQAKDLKRWIEEHIECNARPIRRFSAPFTKKQISILTIVCGRMKVLFDLADAFDIQLNSELVEKYEYYASLNF